MALEEQKKSTSPIEKKNAQSHSNPSPSGMDCGRRGLRPSVKVKRTDDRKESKHSHDD